MERDILCKYGVIFVLLFVTTIFNSGKLLLNQPQFVPKNNTLLAQSNFLQDKIFFREDYVLQRANTYLSKSWHRKLDNLTKTEPKRLQFKSYSETIINGLKQLDNNVDASRLLSYTKIDLYR